MATLEYPNAVRALAPTEINKMTNPQVKKALAILITVYTSAQPSNNDLLEEIRSLKEEMKSMASIKQEVDQLSGKLEQAFQIISQQ